jgi:hypothetical protein
MRGAIIGLYYDLIGMRASGHWQNILLVPKIIEEERFSPEREAGSAISDEKGTKLPRENAKEPNECPVLAAYARLTRAAKALIRIL